MPGDYDLVVIGGGAAGLGAARAGAAAGARTILVSEGEIGGECTFTGCVPSKTLIEAAARGADQGSEYTAKAFRQACVRLSITQSMGRPGSALDNAVIESWHSTLEFELRRVEHFTSRAQARARVAAWIDDYNRLRRHSALQMMSPVDYEQALAGQAA